MNYIFSTQNLYIIIRCIYLFYIHIIKYDIYLYKHIFPEYQLATTLLISHLTKSISTVYSVL